MKRTAFDWAASVDTHVLADVTAWIANLRKRCDAQERAGNIDWAVAVRGTLRDLEDAINVSRERHSRSQEAS